MRAPTIMDGLAGWSWFRNPWLRRAVFTLLSLVILIASIVPRHFEARVRLAPQDALVAGSLLSPTPSDGENLVLPGLPQPVDIELAIARSNEVRQNVSRAGGAISPADAVKMRAMRAGIIEISVKDADTGRALRTASLYSSAVRAHLSTLRESQIASRRSLLAHRMAEANANLARAEAALAAPHGDADTARLTGQRDFARQLQASYARYLSNAARDELTADVRLVEIDRPFIDRQRTVNFAPIALLILVLLFAAVCEFYMIRPPAGNRTRRELRA